LIFLAFFHPGKGKEPFLRWGTCKVPYDDDYEEKELGGGGRRGNVSRFTEQFISAVMQPFIQRRYRVQTSCKTPAVYRHSNSLNYSTCIKSPSIHNSVTEFSTDGSRVRIH
jgi:hypothetical protein